MFTKDELYCIDSLVWRCKNNELCDEVKPEATDWPAWKVFESWEIVHALPLKDGPGLLEV